MKITKHKWWHIFYGKYTEEEMVTVDFCGTEGKNVREFCKKCHAQIGKTYGVVTFFVGRWYVIPNEHSTGRLAPLKKSN